MTGHSGRTAGRITPTTINTHSLQDAMKTVSLRPVSRPKSHGWVSSTRATLRGLASAVIVLGARADETCSSPYMARIEGQEEFLYVWTLGVEGMGDGSDKLVVVDVKPGSPEYGKVLFGHSVGGRHEAHHGGFTDDRRQLWLSGLESSTIFIFDVATDPARPRLVRTIDDFERATGGAVGPHGVYALPGRVLVPCLSNAKDKSGRTAVVEYSNEGDYLAHALAADPGGVPGDRGCGVRRRLRLRRAGSAAKERDADHVVHRVEQLHPRLRRGGEGSRGDEAVWRFDGLVGLPHPAAEEGVPRAGRAARDPLGVGREHNYAFTATALTSKLWLCFEDRKGEWQAREVATVGGEGGVLPGGHQSQRGRPDAVRGLLR